MLISFYQKYFLDNTIYLPTLTPVDWKLRSHTGLHLQAKFSHLIENSK